MPEAEKKLRKIGMSELSRFGYEIRSVKLYLPKTGQLRRLYKIVRRNNVLEPGYLALAVLPRGYELCYDAEKNQPFLKRKLKKDPFPKLAERQYPEQLVEEILDA